MTVQNATANPASGRWLHFQWKYHRVSLGIALVLLAAEAAWVAWSLAGSPYIGAAWSPIWASAGAVVPFLLAMVLASAIRGLIAMRSGGFEGEADRRALAKVVVDRFQDPESFKKDEIEAIAQRVYEPPTSNWVHVSLKQLEGLVREVSEGDRSPAGSLRRWTSIARILSRIRLFVAKVDDGMFGKDLPKGDTHAERLIILGDVERMRTDVFNLLWKNDNAVVLGVAVWSVSCLAVFGLTYFVVGLIVGRQYADMHWIRFAFLICAIAPVCSLIFHHVLHLVRRVTDSTENQVDDLIVSFGLVPLTAFLSLLLFWTAFRQAPQMLGDSMDSIAGALRAYLAAGLSAQLLLIAIVAWAVALIWRHVVIRALRSMAKVTRQEHDDVFVEIVYWIGNYIIAAVAVGAVGTALAFAYAPTSVKDVWFPFTIVFSVGAAILTYSIRETIENFFAGVLFQIDEPVKLGERLVLSSGEVCDVRRFGMRSTTLYNVLENTEMSVPNKVLSNMILTNISRPDKQLRVRIDMFVAQAALGGDSFEGGPRAGHALRHAEAALIYVAYSDDEVSCVAPDEAYEDIVPSEKSSQQKSVGELLHSLAVRHPGEPERRVTELRSSWLRDFGEKQKAFFTGLKAGQGVLDLREEGSNALLLGMADAFSRLSREIYALKECFPPLQDDMDEVLNALAREPVVFSAFEVSDDGVPYVRLSLNCFARFLERRYEVANRLNQGIEAEFAKLGVVRFSGRVERSAKPA